MHLHHRMLRIGHSVQSAVLTLWGWAALISFSSVLTLFVRVRYVLIFFVIIASALTIITLAPSYKRRLAEAQARHGDERGQADQLPRRQESQA